METTDDKKTFSQRNHYLIKLAFIGFIALLLLIPIAFVSEIIRERESLKSQVKNDISEMWGGSQNMVTPILVIPYKETMVDTAKRSYVKSGTLFVSSKDLKIDNNVRAEKRQKGIFSSIVYTNQIKLQGEYSLSEIPRDKNIVYEYNKAYVQLGLTDPSSIASQVELKWNDSTAVVNPGSRCVTTIERGFNSNVIITESIQTYKVFIKFELRGSNFLSYNLTSKNAEISMQSNWPSPEFLGKNLPKAREINKEGFKANWVTNEFNNNAQFYWTDESINLAHSEPIINVGLIETADDYQKNTRSSKYALFIIALSFCTFFVFEFMHKRKIHPIQYLLVGLALAIFYLLLLSLSEQIGFNTSYLISAFAVIGIIITYARAIIPQLKSIAILTGVLIFLYAYIFILLQLEDYALLAGSIGLFIILSAIMLLSRKVNWYNE